MLSQWFHASYSGLLNIHVTYSRSELTIQETGLKKETDVRTQLILLNLFGQITEGIHHHHNMFFFLKHFLYC